MWRALIDIALTNASILYFLANPELKRNEGHRRRFYAVIASFLVEQGETFDWEEICSVQNTTAMRRQEDLKMTPWTTNFYQTLTPIVLYPTWTMVGQHQKMAHCANQCTIQVWTLVQMSSAVQKYAKFVSTRSGASFKSK
jgi:hypothetical protein